MNSEQATKLANMMNEYWNTVTSSTFRIIHKQTKSDLTEIKGLLWIIIAMEAMDIGFKPVVYVSLAAAALYIFKSIFKLGEDHERGKDSKKS